MPSGRCVPHPGLHRAESLEEPGRDGDSGVPSVTHRGGCWAWKHRQLMSFPKEDLADPVTATDYKDPDMVGWYEE